MQVATHHFLTNQASNPLFILPEMVSERMRILIRKFEPSGDAISSRCLATPVSPGVPQPAARAVLGEYYGFRLPRSAQPRDSKKGAV